MRALIDTNIILDLLCDREGFADDAVKLFKLCETQQIEGYVSALSIPNIVYILRKELGREQISKIIQTLSSIFCIADLKGGDMEKAAELPMDDFEDALQSVCAARVRADYIVTRNLKDFTNSKVPAIMPGDLVARIAE